MAAWGALRPTLTAASPDNYTPQLVIDGRLECTGSDLACIRRAIKHAADAPKAVVEINAGPRHDRTVAVSVRVGIPAALTFRESVDVLVAVTEDNLINHVPRGENSGRTLKHSAVVRSLTSIGTLPAHDRTWSRSSSVSLGPEWKPANVRVISFLQERDSRRIVGAGVARLTVDGDDR